MVGEETLQITISNDLKMSYVPEAFKRELMEIFTVVNPKWVENERMGRWNRGTPKVIRCYHRFGGHGIRVPRGYARQLLLKCRRQVLVYRVVDHRRRLAAVDFAFKARLRPFQREAVDQMLARDFGTLTAPTGSGKTVMALAMVAARRQPALIVVHTRNLAEQWVERIGQFMGIAAGEVGRIGGGRYKPGAQITVALVQSLYRRADEMRPRIGHIVVDECHHCPSRTFTEAVSAFDTFYMTGLSATPYRRDGLSRLIFWHLGDQHHRIERRRLEESGDVLQAEVIVRHTHFSSHSDPVNEYSKILMELAADDSRNHLIATDVAREAAQGKGVCLVLSDRKKHCQTLYSLLRYKHGLRVALLTGDIAAAQRQEIVADLDRGEIQVLVATGQLVGEGFDCKRLTTLFLTTPVRFSGRLLQYLGRVLRPAQGKEQARIFDYVDINVAPLANAARARQRVYRRS
jgi:superfamily II DNA or RNA helicase